MAHKSHRKHLKHLHAHEPAKPKAKSPVHLAEIEMARRAKPTAKRAAPATKPSAAKGGANAGAKGGAKGAERAKKGGIVRKIARAAVRKPRAIVARAKARVKSLIGVD